MYSGEGANGGFEGYGGQGGRGGGGGGRGRSCKFGLDCHKFKEGNCTFLHDTGNVIGGGGDGKQGWIGGGGGGRGKPCKFGFDCKKFREGNCPFLHDTGEGTGVVGGPPNNNNNGNLNFCKFFQQSECQKPNCKNPHYFTQGNTLRRVIKMKDVPNNPVSRLTTLLINGAQYFALRQGNQISVFQYNSETAQLNPLPNTIQLEYADIHFYATKEQYIYYAYENKNTSYTNIGYLDVMSNIKVGVENAHKLKVTGLVHIMDPNNKVILLSSSLDGTIKVWNIQGDKLVLNKQLSDGINGCYKTNTNIQVLFLVKETLAGNQILSAGTSDNRLLFWIGGQLNFQQVVFQEQFKKVLSLKYLKVGQSWWGMVIAWGVDNQSSGLIAVDLQTMKYQLMDKQQGVQIRQLHRSMQTIGSLFLVSNCSGFISIYKANNLGNKIGCIMHYNEICDMVSCTSMTSTNIEMLNLFVLEQFVSNDRLGSFQVYSQIQ